MTTLLPFSTSRESIWFSTDQQSRLWNPSTRATNPFVLLHGMLFISIQLGDFIGTLPRFLERLEIKGEGIEERKWVMMGITNLSLGNVVGKSSKTNYAWTIRVQLAAPQVECKLNVEHHDLLSSRCLDFNIPISYHQPYSYSHNNQSTHQQAIWGVQ
jgi:hypothetical protein